MPGATKAVLEDESARASPTTYAGEARLGQLCAVVAAPWTISRAPFYFPHGKFGVLFNGQNSHKEKSFSIISHQTPPCVKLRMAGFTAWNAGVLMKISMAMRMKIPACRREREESRRRTEA